MNYIAITIDLKDCSVKALSFDSQSLEEFANFIKVKITSVRGILYEGNFKKLLKSDGNIILKDTVNAYSEKEYEFIVKMDEKAGNNIQGVVCEFHISMGFESIGKEEPTITPTPIEPTPNPTEYPTITPQPAEPTPNTTNPSAEPDNPLLKPTITDSTAVGNQTSTSTSEGDEKEMSDGLKEISIENGDGNGLGNLPKTGHFADRKSLFLLGGIITMFGFLLAYKGKNAKR